MNSRKRFLYVLLVFLIIIFISIVVIVVYYNNKIEKYDDYKINEISKYLKVNSMFYDGIQENLKTIDNSINIGEIDEIELNRLIASYVITNVVANNDYGYEECKDCYRYFSMDDNIKFYDVDSIDGIYNQLFDGQFKRITQNEIMDFNILYYNEDIDKYYINVIYDSYKPEIISEFKGYSYEDDKLYIDFYYSNVVYEENNNGDDKNNEDDVSEKIYLYNMDDIMVTVLMYNDLYNEDNIMIEYDDYIEYFDIVRYVFGYDKDSNKYLLDEIKLLID